MKVLYGYHEIETSIIKQVLWLSKILEPKEPLWVIGLLNGAATYTVEVCQRISSPLVMDFMRVSSYDGQEKKQLNIQMDPKNKLRGVPILLLDDIFDSGDTIDKTEEYLIDKFNPRIFTTMTCFYKDKGYGFAPYRNLGLRVDKSDFVVGFGLDNKEFDRNLVDLHTLNG